MPLQQKGPDQEVVTQFPMGDVEALGLLKMDFLGLRNLDVLDEALALVDGDLDLRTLPLDDAKTYEMLRRGDASGVFQFESSGMREALRQVKPTEFEDLIALVALYRPGPMSYIPVYGRRKAGGEAVAFADPRLEPITGPTYGICIYQEQYMEIAKQLAGFSPAEADDLRKAIGKKIHALMASLKDKFLEGCAGNGLTPQVANQLWKDMEQAQDYSFNKSHAACYALIAYRTAYLKAHHPAEYMAALISSVMNTKDRVPIYVAACDEMGIEVLPPDVNESAADFAVVEGKIRFGLNAVKNVGGAAAQAIVAARAEGGRFESIWDFTERVDPQLVNKRAVEALAKCGALGSAGATRLGLLQMLDEIVAWGSRHQADLLSGQGSIFDLGGTDAGVPERHHPELPAGEYPKQELLRLEKESLGLYVSEHPLDGVRAALARKADCRISELERRRDGEVVTVGGIVGSLKQITTKKGDQMVFLRLDDLSGSVETVVFNSVLASARDLLADDRILVVKGRVDHKQEGETKLIALDVVPFEGQPDAESEREVHLRVDARKAPAGLIRELADVTKRYPGEASVVVDLELSDGAHTYAFGPEFRVRPESDFYAEVKAILGEAAIRR